MGRTSRMVVEDCEILKVTDALECLRRGFRFGSVPPDFSPDKYGELWLPEKFCEFRVVSLSGWRE